MIQQSTDPYIETFDKGPGGWFADRNGPLPVWDGVAYCFGPWWVDANHAPPGAGYLSLLMWLPTSDLLSEDVQPGNAFVQQNKSTNLTDAKVTVRLRGQMDLKGAQPLLCIQSTNVPGTTVNNVALLLTGQPLEITKDWSEQTLLLSPDPGQWTCLGARHDLTDRYGCAEPAEVLADVNIDIIFLLWPIDAVPLQDIANPHQLWAGRDYTLDQSALPKGLVMFDTVTLTYPSA